MEKVTVRGVPDVLFVLAQPIYTNLRGHQTRVIHAFTATGLWSRTARLAGSEWFWVYTYEGECVPWRFSPYDTICQACGGKRESHEGAHRSCPKYRPETTETKRAWHEREQGWTTIAHECVAA